MSNNDMAAQGPLDRGVRRRFAVRYSAHGLAYLPRKPEEFNLTFQEAKEEVERWKGYADTVGGDAFIVEMTYTQTCEQFADDRRAETIDFLRRALESAERGYWGQCRERAQLAVKAAKEWEHSANTWREWPASNVCKSGIPYMVQDHECKQGKCANATTGCRGECQYEKLFGAATPNLEVRRLARFLREVACAVELGAWCPGKDWKMKTHNPDKCCQNCSSSDICDAYDPLNRSECGAWVGDAFEPSVWKEEGWQPIETAPRDGTKVLICEGEEVGIGWFARWHHFFLQEDMEGWATNWNREFKVPDQLMRPTHWMPIPKAPNGEVRGASRLAGEASASTVVLGHKE